MFKKFFQSLREYFPHELVLPSSSGVMIERGHILRIAYGHGGSHGSSRFKVLSVHVTLGSMGGTFTRLKVRKLLW